MAFARQVASRVYFLDAGSIYEEGPPEELFRHPQKPRTRASSNASWRPVG